MAQPISVTANVFLLAVIATPIDRVHYMCMICIWYDAAGSCAICSCVQLALYVHVGKGHNYVDANARRACGMCCIELFLFESDTTVVFLT